LVAHWQVSASHVASRKPHTLRHPIKRARFVPSALFLCLTPTYLAPVDVFKPAERLMGMTPDVWDRHANPWSVWTRFTCLPCICVAIWSRLWLGWWAIPLLCAALFWTWFNPRAFAPNTRWETWAAQATLGERVWLHHRERVAPHHKNWAFGLTLAAATGLPFLIYGLWAFSLWPLGLGLILTILPKVWFCDRMVWIWQDWRASGRDRSGL